MDKIGFHLIELMNEIVFHVIELMNKIVFHVIELIKIVWEVEVVCRVFY